MNEAIEWLRRVASSLSVCGCVYCIGLQVDGVNKSKNKTKLWQVDLLSVKYVWLSNVELVLYFDRWFGMNGGSIVVYCPVAYDNLTCGIKNVNKRTVTKNWFEEDVDDLSHRRPLYIFDNQYEFKQFFIDFMRTVPWSCWQMFLCYYFGCLLLKTPQLTTALHDDAYANSALFNVLLICTSD